MALQFMEGTGVTAEDRTEADEVENAVWAADDDTSDIEVIRITTTRNDDGTFTVAVNTRFATNDRDAFETELRGLHTAIDSTLEAGAADRMRRE